MTKRNKFEPLFEAAKPFVLERDKNRCVKCGSVLSLEVHHIEGYKFNDPDLLATLCYLCHGIAPMGKAEFSEWLRSGNSGTDILQHHLIKRGLTLNAEQITDFCAALIEMNLDIRISQLRKGREHIRKTGNQCEGIRPYGDKPGETETLHTIRSLRSSGLSCDKIAEALNTNGILARRGGKWLGVTINKILKRESLAAGIPWEPRRKI